MKTEYNVSYGGYKPPSVIKDAPDFIIVNSDIHSVERQVEGETEIEWIAGRADYYTPIEYIAVLEAKQINSEDAILELADIVLGGNL